MNKNASRVGFLPISVMAMALILLPAMASAVQLLNEPFNYPNGPLNGQGGWASHSGTANQVQVVGNTAQAVNTVNSEDVNKSFAAQSATAKTYASFKLKVTAYSGAGTDYFAHLKDTGTLNFRARVFISAPTAGGAFRLGIAATSAGTSPTVNWTSDGNLNQVYLIAIAWDANTGTADLWVDPTSEASPRVTSGPFALATGPAISAFAIREGSAVASTEQIADLAVGTSFADALAPSAVPSVSQWGMMLMAFAMLAAGGWFVVRRRGTVVA